MLDELAIILTVRISVVVLLGFGVINYSLFKFEGYSDQVVQYGPSPTDTIMHDQQPQSMNNYNLIIKLASQPCWGALKINGSYCKLQICHTYVP